MKKNILLILSIILTINSECLASNNDYFLSMPVQIINKKGSVIITDKETSNKNNSDIKYIIIKTQKYNFIPIIVAVLAMLSGIYLAFINSKLTKKRNWYDKYSNQILNINTDIYNLTGNILQVKSESDKYKLEIEIRKIKSQLCALLDSTSQVEIYINEIENFLRENKSYKDRKELFNIVDGLSSYITGVIKK